MYKNIVLALDGSPLAEAAIPHARALAKAFGARVTLLSVVEPVGIYSQPGVVGPVVSVAMNMEEEMENVRQYLETIADQFKAEGIDVKKVVREGNAASRICDYAHESGADLIVMSTHGRSGIQRWVYGSVADKVLRGAKVPILLVRAASTA
ncbi:MAG TPA: universal stress protein [Armatimonadota bacterium]|nr:universal stress protein [Armatimonadota bacterium]